MLQIRNLNVTMKKDLRQLVKDFTFALGPGDKVAIIGEEGNGKSTLLKLLYDPALVEGYVEYTGTIQRDGSNPGYLSQELPPEQAGLSAYQFCCEEPALPGRLPRGAGSGGQTAALPPGVVFMQTGRCPPFPAGRR